MKRLHILLLMMMILFTQPVRSYECCSVDCDVSCCESCPAYCESCRAAHWSVYVPITALIIAAVWLGYADKHCSTNCSSSSSHHIHSISSESCTCNSYSTTGF